MKITEKVRNGFHQVSELVERVLGLDDMLKKHEDDYDVSDRKFKKQVKIDLLRASVELIASQEATLKPKSGTHDRRDEEGNP